MKKYLLVFLSIVCFALVLHSQNPTISKYIFNSFTVAESLPHNFIDDLYKDSHGFIWVSTGGGGLVRYDGYEFLTLNVSSHPISLTSNYIREVSEDNFNRLWVVSNRGIDVINLRTMQKASLTSDVEEMDKLAGINAQSVIKDQNGSIWILSVEKIYKIDFDKNGNIDKIFTSEKKTGETLHSFTSINEIDNHIWVGNGGVIYQVSVSKNGFLTFKPLNEALDFGENTFISTILKKDNTLWIGTDIGLYKFQINSNNLEHYLHSGNDQNSISQDMITSLAFFDDGTLVIGTLRGLNFYDAEKNNFSRISAKTGNKTSLTNDFINCLMPDKGVLWIGTESGGINKMMLPKLITQNYINNIDNPGSISTNPVNAIYEDKNGDLWLGTVEGGLNRKLKGSNSFVHYTTANTNLSHNSVSTIEIDGDDNLWTGTWGGGINILNLNRLSNPTFTQMDFTTQYIAVLKYDTINKGMWIGTNRNIFFYDLQSKRIINPISEPSFQKIWGTLGCLIDDDSNLYMGTSEGLAIIPLKSYNSNTLKFKSVNFTGNGEKIAPLFMRNITSMSMSSDKSIWMGSNGYGICKMTQSKNGYKLQFFDKEHGLAHNTVYGILEDENGLIWISTGHGLSCYNQANNHFANYTTNDGLICNQFYWNAFYKSPTNKNIYFGSNEGLTELLGIQQNSSANTGKIVFTKLQILNKPVWFGENRYLKCDIAYADRVNLHEKDKSFSIEFAALGYDNPSTVSYSYRLLGFDDKWINTGADRRFITYTNLRPGKYTFQVRAMSRGNDWMDETAELEIVVSPYFYKTIWFVSFFIALILWGIYRVYKWRIGSLKSQQELLQQKVERRTNELQNQKKTLEVQADELMKQNEILASQNKKIDAQRKQLIEMSAKVQEAMTDRISFFTNITHEFRTPITLITGPIERALKLSTNPKVIEQLQFVSQNSRHLLSLINQLMDFRKVESDKMDIQTSNGNIVNFLDGILVPFDPYTSERGIKIRRIYRLHSPEIMFDDEVIRKLVTNLLSNSIKFTPDNGSITLYVCSLNDTNSKQEKLYISLKDNGFGIDESEIGKIFDRFYQSKKHEKLSVSGQSGTGIGLYLCTKIAELLGGTISAKNNRGGGATFRILLPLERSNTTISTNEVELQEIINPEHDNSEPTSFISTVKPTILVVEDNHDMRKFISSILSDDYKIVEAENGQEALQLLKSKTIDFIVSDLMMPVMDGLELSNHVKSDFSISHIPFLMLTAKSNVETQISSYKLGVDHFLAKPFDSELLLARINNMIEARRNYQRKFSLNMDLKELNFGDETNDEKFIRQAIQIVKANYKNPNYEVVDFISDMGISKTLLNKKMNMFTGQPAVQFIRNYRLAVAHEFILKQKGNLNISEIAFEVGFNDPKYFTRCFAKHFGVAPSMLSRGEAK